MNIRYYQSKSFNIGQRDFPQQHKRIWAKGVFVLGLIDESEMKDRDFLWRTTIMGNCVRRQGKLYCFFLVINGTLMYLCTPYISPLFC